MSLLHRSDRRYNCKNNNKKCLKSALGLRSGLCEIANDYNNKKGILINMMTWHWSSFLYRYTWGNHCKQRKKFKTYIRYGEIFYFSS